MADTKRLLERAASSAPGVHYDLDDIRDRSTRRRRDGRRRASAVALILTVLVGAAVFSVARRPAGTGITSGPTGRGGSLPAATTAPLVAGDGEYYYRAVLLVAVCEEACGEDDVALDATTWWSPSDDSGRVAVDAAAAYGIDAGRFGPGTFPNANGIDVSDFPHDPDGLLRFLLQRSGSAGESPAPVVTPPPGGAPFDGQLWRAITDLLSDPHTKPAVRAILLEAAATLQGSSVTTDVEDPFGRSAHVVAFANEGGAILERLYVDPASHDLLTWTSTSAGEDAPGRYYVVQDAGIASSMETGVEPGTGSVPPTLLSVDDLRTLGGGASSGAGSTPVGVPERCSQGGPDLTLTRSATGYDHDCFVVEAGAPFTIAFTVATPGVEGRLRIVALDDTVLFEGDAVTGPSTTIDDVDPIGYDPDGANRYRVLDGDVLVGTLYVR